MDSDKLHLAASAYANMRKDQFDEADKQSLPPAHIRALYQWLWVAHYEGFKNGYEAKQQERQDAR